MTGGLRHTTLPHHQGDQQATHADLWQTDDLLSIVCVDDGGYQRDIDHHYTWTYDERFSTIITFS